ncbi:MAG: hypothetical protein ACI89U_003325, partial [Gammaproteobacteria bacterium]
MIELTGIRNLDGTLRYNALMRKYKVMTDIGIDHTPMLDNVT